MICFLLELRVVRFSDWNPWNYVVGAESESVFSFFSCPCYQANPQTWSTESLILVFKITLHLEFLASRRNLPTSTDPDLILSGFIRRRLNEFFGTLQRRGLSVNHGAPWITPDILVGACSASMRNLRVMYIEAFLIFGVNESGQAWSMFYMNYWATAHEVRWTTLSQNRRTRQGWHSAWTCRY